MSRGENSKRFFGVTVVIFALIIAFVLAPFGKGQAEEAQQDYVEKAKLEAEKARNDAAKAMTEAEAAIAEAEAAIAKAEKAKAQAKEEKAKALEKMVEAGNFPDDISMTEPGSETIAVFSHKKHTAREKLRCIECHPKVFIMKVGKNVVKKGQLTMSEMKKGKYCGNCHNGKKAFSVTSIKHCKRCHPKS